MRTFNKDLLYDTLRVCTMPTYRFMSFNDTITAGQQQKELIDEAINKIVESTGNALTPADIEPAISYTLKTDRITPADTLEAYLNFALNLKADINTSVYVITAGAYEDYHIIATCTDKTKADQICDEYNKSYNNIPYAKASVEEYEDKSDLNLNQHVYTIIYDPLKARELHGEDKVNALCEVYHSMNKVYMYQDQPLFIYLTAHSKEEAIQKAESILKGMNTHPCK